MRKTGILATAAILTSVILASCGQGAEGKGNGSELAGGENDSDYPASAVNVYFPYMDDVEKVMAYCAELSLCGTVNWESSIVESRDDRKLFKISYDGVDLDTENLNDEIAEQKLEMYFWVTEDEIYWLRNESEKGAVTFFEGGNIPESALLVCNEEGKDDVLGDGEEGTHEIIETHPDGIRWYRSWYDRGFDHEGRDCVTLIWKEAVGLIAYQYKRAAPGGGSIQVWDPTYVEPYLAGYRLLE